MSPGTAEIGGASIEWEWQNSENARPTELKVSFPGMRATEFEWRFRRSIECDGRALTKGAVGEARESESGAYHSYWLITVPGGARELSFQWATESVLREFDFVFEKVIPSR